MDGAATNDIVLDGGTLKTTGGGWTAIFSGELLVTPSGGTIDSNGFNADLGAAVLGGTLVKEGAGVTKMRLPVGNVQEGCLETRMGIVQVPQDGSAVGTAFLSKLSLRRLALWI